MNQQIIHGLPTTTHATPINKTKPITPHIITSEYLIPSRIPNKKETHLGVFTPKIHFQEKVIEEESSRAL